MDTPHLSIVNGHIEAQLRHCSASSCNLIRHMRMFELVDQQKPSGILSFSRIRKKSRNVGQSEKWNTC